MKKMIPVYILLAALVGAVLIIGILLSERGKP